MGEFEARANTRNYWATLIATAVLLIFTLGSTRAQEKLIFGHWEKVCQNQMPAGQRPFCTTATSAFTEAGQLRANVILFESDDGAKLFRIVLPANGARPATVALNPGPSVVASSVKCENQVCSNDYKATDTFISQLKGAKSLTVLGVDVGGKKFSLAFSLSDFKTVSEGAGLDAREVEAQQKRAKEDLERRAAEMRKKLDQESEQKK